MWRLSRYPRTLPRLFEIGGASDRGGKPGRRSFILLSTLIETELASLFPGRDVVSDSSVPGDPRQRPLGR